MEENREALLERRSELLETLIAECVRIKADVVSGDERESGERRILNFGHTVGHALEAETNYKRFLHGEAVAWGMIAAVNIGVSMRVTDAATARRINDLVLSYGPLPEADVNPKRVFKRLLSDKKSVGGVPHFVLATAIGQTQVVSNVPRQVIIDAVKDVRRMSKA
jgi:3-dehydroquinate synthase